MTCCFVFERGCVFFYLIYTFHQYTCWWSPTERMLSSHRTTTWLNSRCSLVWFGHQAMCVWLHVWISEVMNAWLKRFLVIWILALLPIQRLLSHERDQSTLCCQFEVTQKWPGGRNRVNRGYSHLMEHNKVVLYLGKLFLGIYWIQQAATEQYFKAVNIISYLWSLKQKWLKYVYKSNISELLFVLNRGLQEHQEKTV